MNEGDLESRLRSAYRSRAGRADPGALSERVHSIPATVAPERRRWWHGFGFGASRSAGSGRVEVKGASNMLTATRIATIVAALVLGTTFLAVQVGDPPDTTQQPAAPTGETWITVTGSQEVGLGGGGELSGQRLNMSDPRFEGAVRVEYEQEDADNSGLNSTVWSTVTITNDEGSWVGQSIGFVDQQGFHHHMGWFEGAGAYEGLAYIEQLTEPQLSGGLDLDVIGLVYEGELPPMVLPAWAPTTE